MRREQERLALIGDQLQRPLEGIFLLRCALIPERFDIRLQHLLQRRAVAHFIHETHRLERVRDTLRMRPQVN